MKAWWIKTTIQINLNISSIFFFLTKGISSFAAQAITVKKQEIDLVTHNIYKNQIKEMWETACLPGKYAGF